jgi:hypothetical protein
MVYFQTKNPNFGKIWNFLQWEMLVSFMTIRSILRPFGIFLGHLVYFMFIWYIFTALGCCSKKNLATLTSQRCESFFQS